MTDRFILGKQGKALIDAALAGPLEVSLEGALHFGDRGARADRDDPRQPRRRPRDLREARAEAHR